MHFIVTLTIYLTVLRNTSGYFGLYHRRYQHPASSTNDCEDDPGTALFLTPYLEEGKIDEARRLSMVQLLPLIQPSFSGYLTVNKTYNSNMFFWFFPAQNKSTLNTPIVLWLQGGPGTSSLLGLFNEIGPILIDENGNIQSRSITWNTNYHLLFIDNPVGTGFSFTLNDQGFARTQDDVARDLYECLLQFFQIYTDYVLNPLYIAGESYAGKYVPAITYKIHMENLEPYGKIRINLKGMAIGDGVCDPVNQYDYGDFLYQIGFIDKNQKFYVDLQVALMLDAVRQERYSDAFQLFDALINGVMINTTSYFYNVTGIKDYYNYLHTLEPIDQTYFIPFITQASRRKQIHVGNVTFGGQKDTVAFLLLSDVMKSMAEKITAICNANYSVLIYNGQLDAIIPAVLTMNWVNKLQWFGADELRQVERTVWKVSIHDNEVAGYLKKANNDRFFLALVRNAGHMVPYDQPRAMLDLLDRFVTAHK